MDAVDPALAAMWRSTVLERIDAATAALLGPGSPDTLRALAVTATELQSALESVLAAAKAMDDDPALQARLEAEADELARLAQQLDTVATLGDETSGAARQELEAARRRLERVFS
jgi:hypothetical protein